MEMQKQLRNIPIAESIVKLLEDDNQENLEDIRTQIQNSDILCDWDSISKQWIDQLKI